ncbi:hypothetical protein TNCV_883671 [Trichonephila clavipes]|nr:hypothetical protein TNCV_883671 [Trichonephila clavipes]
MLFIAFHSLINKLKLSGATAHEGQGLLCPSQYTGSLGVEVHEQMYRSGGQPEARPHVFKSPTISQSISITKQKEGTENNHSVCWKGKQDSKIAMQSNMSQEKIPCRQQPPVPEDIRFLEDCMIELKEEKVHITTNRCCQIQHPQRRRWKKLMHHIRGYQWNPYVLNNMSADKRSSYHLS